MATDASADRPLSSRVPVTIDVLDANDNDPHFERKEYDVTVSELAALGSTVVALRAVDNDEDGAPLR